jgi:hypothetical protein
VSESWRHDGEQMRERDRRHVRWPVLAVITVLGLLLVLTTALERAAPLAAPLAPPISDLPLPVLDHPQRCSRVEDDRWVEELRNELRPDGRLTSAIATACPRLLDGLPVVYFGEVVGDVLRRDGGAWVQVNDDAYALDVGPFGSHRIQQGYSSGLAVWLPDGLHEGLGEPGRHGRRGDVVRIEGVLLRADPRDGGGMTVRASTLAVVAPSRAVPEPLNRPLVVAAAVAATVALASWVWARRRARERTR